MPISWRRTGLRHREHAVRVFLPAAACAPVCGVGPAQSAGFSGGAGSRRRSACGRRSGSGRALRREGAFRDGMRHAAVAWGPPAAFLSPRPLHPLHPRCKSARDSVGGLTHPGRRSMIAVWSGGRAGTEPPGAKERRRARVTKAGELPWIPTSTTNAGPSDPLTSPALLIGKTREKQPGNVRDRTGCPPQADHP
jgi:hypothetical protein